MSILQWVGATDGSLRKGCIMVDTQEFLSLSTIALKPLHLSSGLILQVMVGHSCLPPETQSRQLETSLWNWSEVKFLQCLLYLRVKVWSIRRACKLYTTFGTFPDLNTNPTCHPILPRPFTLFFSAACGLPSFLKGSDNCMVYCFLGFTLSEY